MFSDYDLPTTVELSGVEYDINYTFRDILDIFKVFNDPDLTEMERQLVALNLFYLDFEDIPQADLEEAIHHMHLFMNGNKEYNDSGSNKPVLYDWEQDLPIIIAPVNKVLGYDVRSKDDLHWWTFLSAFMEIGECTFSTYVAIRDKRAKNQKLEKYEERIFRENSDQIIIKKKVDSVTQSIMDEIMGKK